MAYVTKVLRGGRVPIPVVQAYLYRADAGVEGLVFPTDVPPKRSRRAAAPAAKRGGCAAVLAVAAVPLAAMFAHAAGL